MALVAILNNINNKFLNKKKDGHKGHPYILKQYHEFTFLIYFFKTNVPFNLISFEEEPTITSKLPELATHAFLATS